MKKSRLSLAFKLNLLIMAIVLIVSLILVGISYNSFSETAYLPYETKLEYAKNLISKDTSEWTQDLSYFYQVTQMDGFEEARAASLENDEDTPIGNFLDAYIPNPDTGKIETIVPSITVDEDSEGAYAVDPVSLEIIYMNFRIDNIYKGVAAGIDRIRILVENEQGMFVQLENILVSDEFMILTEGGILGERFDYMEEISTYKAQKEHRTFSISTDEETDLVRVESAEKDGLIYYILYYCNISSTLAAQRVFLSRCLLLVGLMVLAAIGVSLFILRRIATKPLLKLTNAVDRFSLGKTIGHKEEIIDLDIKSGDEIGDLYQNIRAMQIRIIDDAENLERMTSEKQRIYTELEVATKIQARMLPSTFPPYPDRTEFDIFASMRPAKEVGGDFYDFFMIDEDHLALVIADVSGKGVPAALFMMASKIMLENSAKHRISPAMVLKTVNAEICSKQEEMFVTVWLGILELSTGKLTAANAGHEYPVLKQPEDGFTIFKERHGFVLGGLAGMNYVNYEVLLRPGAKLFVYTDGVTEAIDVNEDLFGTKRMLMSLNEVKDDTPEEILRHVREAVDDFAGEEEQFDDMTMLCLEYKGR